MPENVDTTKPYTNTMIFFYTYVHENFHYTVIYVQKTKMELRGHEEAYARLTHKILNQP